MEYRYAHKLCQLFTYIGCSLLICLGVEPGPSDHTSFAASILAGGICSVGGSDICKSGERWDMHVCVCARYSYRWGTAPPFSLHFLGNRGTSRTLTAFSRLRAATF